MNIELIARWFGFIAILFLFLIDFWVAINPRTSLKTARINLLWTAIYFLSLFLVRGFSIFNIGTVSQLRIISGFSSAVPLAAVLIELYANYKLDKALGNPQIIIKPVKVINNRRG